LLSWPLGLLHPSFHPLQGKFSLCYAQSLILDSG
jgi:hypothetical protein